ncbi:hypothetical protein [Marinifilum flexuosum]|uniref:hypothetical protein n=1 Tax=Marinifilum flexuosum TaxID=1117708 RepID=UPI002493A1E4|nr:hypothetical protein [Marinifilum flexuosum]
MSEIYSIVECKVEYNDGTLEIFKPTFSQISAGLASVDHLSVINYLKDNLKNVKNMKVIDTLYFRNKHGYDKYMLG